MPTNTTTTYITNLGTLVITPESARRDRENNRAQERVLFEYLLDISISRIVRATNVAAGCS